MTQKINSKIKEIYFNPPSSVRSFNEPSKYSEMRKSSRSFLETKKHSRRYSEEEISKFANFFNKHYYHPNTEADIPISNKQENMDFLDVFEPLHLEDFDSNFEPNTKTFTYSDQAYANFDNAVAPTLEHDLYRQSAASDIDEINQDEKTMEHAIVAREDVDEEMVEFIHEEKVDDALEDDLIYLENLVSNGGNGIATTPLGSIGNLLDEIVDNEKNQISNYETDVFNANIQSLFHSDPEASLSPVPQPPVVPIPTPPPISPSIPIPSIPSTPPMMPTPPVASNNEELETEIESSDTAKHIEPNDNPVVEDLNVDADALNAKIKSFHDSKGIDDHNFEKETFDEFVDFVPDKQLKTKKSKLDFYDIILVILLFITVGIMLFQFRYLLPFHL